MRALISYAHFRGAASTVAVIRDLAARGWRIMLDSGAFSAFNSGKSIDLGEYCAFLAEHGGFFERYVVLDVIGDAAATRRNLAEMRRRGLDPMPVLTMTAPTEEAADLVAGCAGAPQLCVAGGTGKSNEPEEWYLARVAAVRALAPGAWLHALGFTRSLRLVARCAADAYDSSTASSAPRYGQVTVFDRRALDIRQLRGGVHLGSLRRRPADVECLLRAGLSADDLRSENVTRERAVEASCLAWADAAEFMERLGKHLYFAAVSAHQLRVMERALARRAGAAA